MVSRVSACKQNTLQGSMVPFLYLPTSTITHPSLLSFYCHVVDNVLLSRPRQRRAAPFSCKETRSMAARQINPYDQHVTFAPPPAPLSSTQPHRPSPHLPNPRSHKTRRRRHKRPRSFKWGIASVLTPNARFWTASPVPSRPPHYHKHHHHHHKHQHLQHCSQPDSQSVDMSSRLRRSAGLSPLLPINEPAPAYLHSPTLYGETTTVAAAAAAAASSPHSPNSYNDILATNTLNDAVAIGEPHHGDLPSPRSQNLAALLINRNERRQRRAWILKRGNASTSLLLSSSPSPSSFAGNARVRDDHCSGCDANSLESLRSSKVVNRVRLARFCVFGLALVGVLTTCMSWILSFPSSIFLLDHPHLC